MHEGGGKWLGSNKVVELKKKKKRKVEMVWSKSEREKQILCISTKMWNPGKWCRWTYWQSRNRDTDIERKCMNTKGGGREWDGLGDWDWQVYTTMYKTDKNWLYSTGGFPGIQVGKESACSAGDLGSIPGSGRSPGEGNGNPLQYSCLENPMDRGAWRATDHGVARVRRDLATTPPPPYSTGSSTQ